MLIGLRTALQDVGCRRRQRAGGREHYGVSVEDVSVEQVIPDHVEVFLAQNADRVLEGAVH